MKKITIVGIGMGHEGGLTVDGWDAIDMSELIIGGSRIVECVKNMGDLIYKKPCVKKWRPEEICDEIAVAEEENIVVLMSGDTGFNSGSAHLLDEMESRGLYDEYEITVLPGISAISNLASVVGVGWEESALISLHGRRQNLYQALCTFDKVFVLSGEKTSDVMKSLAESEFKNSEVCIGEVMGSEDENIIHYKRALEYEPREFDSMTTMLIFPEYEKTMRISGIRDEEFIRDEVPMTKSEVRALSVSKMAIRKNDIVYDIGCGTGSISVEAACAACYGKVYAFDKNPKAIELTKKNANKFFSYNIKTIEGAAPEVLEENNIEACDVAFIGGSDGKLKEIISALKKQNENVRIVLNAITIENANEAVSVLKEEGFSDININLVMTSTAKECGDKHMMIGANPIYIISADGCADIEQSVNESKNES